MRRLGPHLFTLCAGASLLLCGWAVTTLVREPDGAGSLTYRGGVGWTHGDGITVCGVGLHEFHAFSGPVMIVTLPRWLMISTAVCSAVLPSAWLRRGRLQSLARERARVGLCPACGYDLRATRGRCPECGAEQQPEFRTSTSPLPT